MRLPLVALAMLAAALWCGTMHAQNAAAATQSADSAEAQPLPHHVPQWANAGNDRGAVPASQTLENLVIVVARTPEQQAAFEQLLRDQQDATSPDYHHWLNAAEIGDRFGRPTADMEMVTGWLRSNGLRVTWVSPSKTLIGFGGTAADIGRAFQTELHNYNVNGVQRMSVSSNPMVPAGLSSMIKGVRGLYSTEDTPQHISRVQSYSPDITLGAGAYVMGPADFDTIYDVPPGQTGAGVTVGIVGESRTDFADFTNFRSLTGATFANPTEVVPTALGGVDPGPAYTAPPTGGASAGLQSEATLDVLRVGSVAPAANLLLVVATSASGGVAVDAVYLVDTVPVPAQVMSISFGACESSAGPSGVDFWDSLFQTGAAEGMSIFASSGDSGASGCDAAFMTPPASPKANSPSYICSSSYATCVGGTEFNDTSNPATYWSNTNGAGLLSALSYIPEGGWNEPMNGTATQVAASGGGVSSVIATPSWQTGTGVPAARAGRYTPDVAFSASGHDGYFGCFAAGGGSCVASGGSIPFNVFAGTSAAAPGMAGVAALLDQKLGGAQGNLNPEIYSLAAHMPTAFHDVTVASSGVTSCSVNLPSMCNNSAPSPTGLTGGQAGYLVTAGYDEVTGLGSLDVKNFIDNYAVTTSINTFSISPTTIASGGSAKLSFQLTEAAPSGGASLALSSSNTSAFPVPATFTIAAGQTSGSFMNQAGAVTSSANVTVTASYNGRMEQAAITVTPAAGKTTPTVSVASSLNPSTYGASVTFTANVSGSGGTPTGTVTFLDGTTTLGTGTLGSGSAKFMTNALGVGAHSITASYGGDTNFNTAKSGVLTQTVNKSTPTVTLISSLNPSTVGASVTFTATVTGAGLTPTAAIAFLDGTTTLATVSPSSGVSKYTTTTLTAGSHSMTASFVGGPEYNAAKSSVLTQTVNPATKTNPTLSVTNSPVAYNGKAQAAMVMGSVAGTVSNVLYSGSATVPSTPGTYAITANFAPTDTTDYNSLTGASAGNFVINKTTPTIALTSSLNPSTVGASVTFTVTLTGTGIPPGGPVTFLDGTTALVTETPSGGVAKYTTTTLTAGSHSITANFAGGIYYNPTSSRLTQTVNKVTPTLSVSNSPVAYNGKAQAATVIGSVAGTVSNVLYSGSATVPGTPGTYAITASFTPTDTTHYNSLTGASAGNFVINKTTPTIALTSSLNPSTVGASVTFTVTLIGTGIPPGGPVTFLDGTTALVTETPSGGVAKYTTTALTAGSHSITANFAGGIYYNPTSSKLTQTVN